MAGLYFPHDLNARNDSKCIRLRMAMGANGYGVLNLLYELLGVAPDHTLSTDYASIAWELHVDAADIERVVTEFDLFIIDESRGVFYSKRMSEQFNEIETARQKRSEAGRKAVAKRYQTYTTANKKSSNGIADLDNNASNGIAYLDTSATNIDKYNIDKSNINLKEEEEEEEAAQIFDFSRDTYSPSVVELADAIAQRFGLLKACGQQLWQTQKLLQAIHIDGQDTLQVVRDGLKRLDTAKPIATGAMPDFGIDQFLNPDLFLRLIHGGFDKLKEPKGGKKNKGWSRAGESFSDKPKDYYRE